MSVNSYTHLNLFTQYSFLDGAIRINNLAPRVLQLNMKSIAITDYGNMYGVLDFYTHMLKYGIKPIIGMRIFVTRRSFYTQRYRDHFPLTLIAENNVGFQNLKILSTKAFFGGKYYYPRIDKKILFKYKEGLICLTGGLQSEIAQSYLYGGIKESQKVINDYKNMFGLNNLFLEIQINKLVEQQRLNSLLLDISRKKFIRTIVTNPCHYLLKNEYESYMSLVSLKNKKFLHSVREIDHDLKNFYVKSPDAIWKDIKNIHKESFFDTCRIGVRCNVNIKLREIHLPIFTLPHPHNSEKDYLCFLGRLGLQKRFSKMHGPIDKKTYWFRLEYELNVITSMGFSNYFLVVQDFVNWSKNHSIRVGPGRGSGSGSLLSYSLRITDINPLEYNLLFERFLNPERITMPDIDIDFMQEKRMDIIYYIASIYGDTNVAQIVTYSEWTPKSIIKDMARLLNISFHYINYLTRLAPNLSEGKKLNIDDLLKTSPKMLKIIKGNKLYETTILLSKMLEGLFRQAGIHAGGVVIGNQHLINYAPLFLGPKYEKVIQLDKDDSEEVGLIKFDLLGLKTLDIIDYSVFLVNRRIKLENNFFYHKRKKYSVYHQHFENLKDIEYDYAFKMPILFVEDLTPNDLFIYDFITEGQSDGIFQMESKGFKSLCKRLKPNCFEDIVALLALYRPGPMKSGMLRNFIHKKHHPESIDYMNIRLKSVLVNTYGTFVYQEQIMEAAQKVAGYTLGEADILRKAMGKKDAKEMDDQKKNFVKGAENLGIIDVDAEYIFDKIYEFAGYCFNKSHSASYATLSYHTAYLKYYYPIEFTASMLTIAMISNQDITSYLHDIKNKGIQILHPDVNFSEKSFVVEYMDNYYTEDNKSHTYGGIRFAFEGIKGLGTNLINTIIERRKTGNFKSITDFLNRCMDIINYQHFEILVSSGALDKFENTRKEKLNINFDIEKYEVNFRNEILSEWNIYEKLKHERRTLTIYLLGHPLNNYTKYFLDLENDHESFLSMIHFNELLASSILRKPADTILRLSIAAIITNIDVKTNENKKKKWADLTLDYGWGKVKTLCRHNLYSRIHESIEEDLPLFIRLNINYFNTVTINQVGQNELIPIIKSELSSFDKLQGMCGSYYQEFRCILSANLSSKLNTKKKFKYEILKFISICEEHKGSCQVFCGVDIKISVLSKDRLFNEIYSKNNIPWMFCPTMSILPSLDFFEKLNALNIISYIICK